MLCPIVSAFLIGIGCQPGTRVASVSTRPRPTLRERNQERTRDEIATAHSQLRAMLKSGGEVPDAPFDGYEALLPARDYKHRHASILLALEATLEAMDQAAGETGAAQG